MLLTGKRIVIIGGSSGMGLATAKAAAAAGARVVAMPKDVRDEMFQHYAAATPLNRAGQPEEIAQTVLYLMTNTLTTGATLYVDGGYTLR